ncbi:MAG TPA: hypothetical protein VL523_20430 [Terriglobia bacterium]|nr:hypothetical protein [Terriglobia bacterium]
MDFTIRVKSTAKGFSLLSLSIEGQSDLPFVMPLRKKDRPAPAGDLWQVVRDVLAVLRSFDPSALIERVSLEVFKPGDQHEASEIHFLDRIDDGRAATCGDEGAPELVRAKRTGKAILISE